MPEPKRPKVADIVFKCWSAGKLILDERYVAERYFTDDGAICAYSLLGNKKCYQGQCTIETKGYRYSTNEEWDTINDH